MAIAIGGFMANSKNKEIARKAEEQTTKLISAELELKLMESKVRFNNNELDRQHKAFLNIIKNKINFTGKTHWREFSNEEIEYIGSALNIARTMAVMLNKKIV